MTTPHVTTALGRTHVRNLRNAPREFPLRWIAALWIALLGLMPVTTAMADTLRIGAETTFAPYVMLDEAGELTGFDRDFGDALCARAGLTCEWVLTDFDALIPGVASGQFDLAMSGLGNSAERREVVDFTTVYLPSSLPSAYVGPLGAPEPQAALIGVQAGTIHEAHVAERGLRYARFGSAQAALDALTKGDVDLVFGASSYFEQILPRAYPSIVIVLFEAVSVEGTAIAIGKGREALRARLDATIAEMLADGTIAQLAVSWFTARTSI